MTGYESKRAAAQDKLAQPAQEPVVFNTLTSLRHKKTVGPIESAMRNIASTQPAQVYQDHDDALTIAYQSGYYDGKKAAQPAQEPVAWRFRSGTWFNREAHWRYISTLEGIEGLRGLEPLYTTPPQEQQSCDKRPWVGLTDEEILQIRENLQVVEGISLLKNLTKAIETKLKEKNT